MIHDQSVQSERGPVVPSELPPEAPTHIDAAFFDADDRRERWAQVYLQLGAIVRSGFTAGGHYREVWIRDLGTFLPAACALSDRDELRAALLRFLSLQADDGSVPDAIVPEPEKSSDYRTFIRSESLPGYVAIKNTVSADQESWLVHSFATYVELTGETDLLDTEVMGVSVIERLERSLDYLFTVRFSSEHGLVHNAATIDWHDVQPEDSFGLELTSATHRAVSVYTNATVVHALDRLIGLPALSPDRRDSWKRRRAHLAESIRRVLWDADRCKFRPHRYLSEGSPFSDSLDEDAIFFPHGTSIAARLGILNIEEAGRSLAATREATRRAEASSVGFSPWPPYPAGAYAAKGIRPWNYANGGDWTWWGAQTVDNYRLLGFEHQAAALLDPMITRVERDGTIYEWYTRENEPQGSSPFRSAAGTLWIAMHAFALYWRSEGLPGREPGARGA